MSTLDTIESILSSPIKSGHGGYGGGTGTQIFDSVHSLMPSPARSQPQRHQPQFNSPAAPTDALSRLTLRGDSLASAASAVSASPRAPGSERQPSATPAATRTAAATPQPASPAPSAPQPFSAAGLTARLRSPLLARRPPPPSPPDVELCPSALLLAPGAPLTVHFVVVPSMSGFDSDGDSDADDSEFDLGSAAAGMQSSLAQALTAAGIDLRSRRGKPGTTPSDYIEVFPALDAVPLLDDAFRARLLAQPPFDRAETCGALSGAVSLTVPTLPGVYIVRYLHGTAGEVAARSAPLTVAGRPPAPPAAAALEDASEAEASGGEGEGALVDDSEGYARHNQHAYAAGDTSFALSEASSHADDEEDGGEGLDGGCYYGHQEHGGYEYDEQGAAYAMDDEQGSDAYGMDGASGSRAPTVPVVFTWPAHASDGVAEVHLTGDFLGWIATGIPLARDPERPDSDWSVAVELPPGCVVEYKFILDEYEWRYDPDQPHVADGRGHVNNVLTVPGSPPQLAQQQQQQQQATAAVGARLAAADGGEAIAAAVSEEEASDHTPASGNGDDAEVGAALGDAVAAVEAMQGMVDAVAAVEAYAAVDAHTQDASAAWPVPPAVMSAPSGTTAPPSPPVAHPAPEELGHSSQHGDLELPMMQPLAMPPLPPLHSLLPPLPATPPAPPAAWPTAGARGSGTGLPQPSPPSPLVPQPTPAPASAAASPSPLAASPAKKRAPPSAVTAPLVTGPDGSASALASRPAIRPPFLLEKHVRISTYQLYVPTPAHLVLPAAPEEMPPGLVAGTAGAVPIGGGALPQTDAADSEQTPLHPVTLPLPSGWRPGVAFDDESDGVLPAVEAAYELPDVPEEALVAAAGMGLSALPLPLRDPMKLVARSPRVLHCLRLQLDHRLDQPSASLRLFADHISLRLPMFYAGGALPDRPSSLVSPAEIAALKAHGGALACRQCGAALLRKRGAALPAAAPRPVPGSAGTAPSASAPPAPEAPLRALVLPSEHWLEWSDFWLCHEEERTHLIPEVDFGAIAGALLIGETALQLHPRDVRAVALVLRPSRNRPSLMQMLPPAPGAAGRGRAPTHCSIQCATCYAVLGSTVATPPPAPGGGSAAAFVLPSIPGWASLRDKLSVESDPVVRLFKDAVTLPPTPVGAEAAAAARGGDSESASPESGGVFAPYSLCTRVAAELYSSAHTHQQYRYIIAASDSSQPQQASQQGSQSDLSGARFGLVLLNWNTSIRGASTPLALPNAAPSTTGAATTGEHFDRDRDVPVLKLRFVPLGSPLAAREWEEAAGGASSPSQLLHLPSADCDAVGAMLAYTNGLLPPSVRALDGMALGYLPFA